MKTIEEKAKAYDEALELAKQIRNGNPSSGTAIVVCEQIFPELCESEDERIIEEIKFAIMQMPSEREDTKQRCLAYLEKQKEQKPNIEICPHSIKSKSYKENYYPIEDCDYGLEIAFDILEKTFGEVRGYQTDDGIREHQTAIEAVRKAKEQKPIEFKNDELVEIIKGEFEGFRTLLKKKGIDYNPQRSYWEGFARLFDSSAREYVKEQKEQKPAEGLEDEIEKCLDGFVATPTRDYFREAIKHYYALGRQSKETGFPTTDEEMEEFLATHPKVEVPEKYKTPDWMFEKPSEELEEEMIAWHKEHFKGKRKWEETSGEYLEHSSQLDIARHFAQWGAEHLKK